MNDATLNDTTKLILTVSFGIVSVFTGWVLGLWTPQIVDNIRRRHDRGRIAGAIVVELREIGERLAASAYYTWSLHGTLTIERLRWAAGILEQAQYHPRHKRGAANLKKLAEQGAEYLERQNAHAISEQQRLNRRISPRRIDSPYLASSFGRLDVFPEGTRRALLSIDAQLRIYNEIVDECKEFGRMTFNESITGANREAVIANLRFFENALATRAEYLVTLLGRLDLNAATSIPGEALDEPAAMEEVGLAEEDHKGDKR